MATIPKNKVSKGATTDQVVNAVLNEASKTYSGVPNIRVQSPSDNKSMHLIGEAMNNDIDLANGFIKQLINRIVKTIYVNIYFTNPLKRFKRGLLESGEAVEEIAFSLCDPHDYDSTTDFENHTQEKEYLYAQLHFLNYEKYYKKTINRRRLLQAFVSVQAMDGLIREMIKTLYVSAEVDEFISMKYLVGKALLRGMIVPIKIPSITTENMKEIASILKSTSNNMALIGSEYNRFGLPTATETRNQIVLINTDFEAKFSVDILAYAFNMEKADIYGQKILINNWKFNDIERLNKLFKKEMAYKPFTAEEIALLNSVPAYVLDNRFFMIFDYLLDMTSFMQPEKLYWNYWLHTWRVMSVSPFVNAVAFTPNVQNAVSIEIEKKKGEVFPGGSLELKALVKGDQQNLFVNQQVSWEINGNTSKMTYITNTGYVSIGDDEQASSITAIAKTINDNYETISASMEISILGNNG